MHTMMAFPGQVLMEYNLGERGVPYMPEFLECRNGKVWPNDRPGLGVSVDEKQLTFVEAMTEGAPAPTHRRPDGSLTHCSRGCPLRAAREWDRVEQRGRLQIAGTRGLC
jgi:hypothetical protein